MKGNSYVKISKYLAVFFVLAPTAPTYAGGETYIMSVGCACVQKRPMPVKGCGARGRWQAHAFIPNQPSNFAWGTTRENAISKSRQRAGYQYNFDIQNMHPPYAPINGVCRLRRGF
jgi:hypothetical protein